MYKQIATQGYCQLKDLTNDVANKYTLNTVNDFLIGCGLMSDLVTDTLELRRTIDERKVRKSSIEKNAQKNDKEH
jgi:hypothetical protein